MANIASNSNNQMNNGSNGGNITSLREIYSFLDQSIHLPAGANPYDHIVEMIRGLDLQDDGIMMNHKIKAIESDFCTIVHDENMLSESMNYINSKALEDGEIALKFALLFSSRNFDALAMKETKVRSAMLKILETNFLNAETFRMCAKDRLYNSITLLGEYYHRVRLADNQPITILGESLMGLLVHEIEGLEIIDAKLAKLILSQMTLNGDIMRTKHQTDITQLLFHIRRNLVEQPQLSSTAKALLLMTLDLYYSNFANLGTELESFYTKYLVNQEQDEGNNNQNWVAQEQKFSNHSQQEKQQLNQCDPNTTPSTQQESENENESFVSQPTTKKWSEQVCEDSMFENELNEGLNDSGTAAVNDRLNSNNLDPNSPPNHERDQRHNRRSQRPRSPRPLKHTLKDKRGSNDYLGNSPQGQNGEEADQSKPLPRWRATRFNRDQQEDNQQHNENTRNRFRRLSGSFDDDHQSVRSEGGSIRLYSINDRLKHSMEKMERSNNNYNFIVNSNWDRQSQRDDRSERSYISNYEYGNNQQRRGYRGFNNRQNYDKPPRFQKNRKLQHPSQSQQGKDDKIYSDNWRRTRTNSNNSFNEDFDDARASTLPRTTKSNYEGSIKSASFRRSQSPNHQREFHKNQQHRGNSRNFNGRYGSQNSIAHGEEVADSGTRDQQQHQRHHNNHRGGRRFNINPRRQPQQQSQEEQQQQQQQPWEQEHHNTSGVQEENSELVRNARQTTNYMNYLSSKK